MITNCVQKIIRIKEQKESYVKKPKLDFHKKFCAFRSGIEPFKYKGEIKMKISEDNEINMKIKKLWVIKMIMIKILKILILLKNMIYVQN